MSRKVKFDDTAATDAAPLEAGNFSAWLADIRRSLESGGGMTVPCGACRGCCTSSYFIHVGEDEKDSRRAIPKALLFPAPGQTGVSVMGFGRDGRCPMLVDNECSIYGSRPRTCRQFDCRVLAAAGLEDECGRPLISAQAKRWRFSFDAPEDERAFRAVRSAARFLVDNTALFPSGFVPSHAPQQAILAIKVHGLFLEEGAGLDAVDLSGFVQRVKMRIDAG